MAGSLSHTYTNQVRIPGLPALPADPSVTVIGNAGFEVEEDLTGSGSLATTVGTITAASVVSLIFNTTVAAIMHFNSTTGQTVTLAAQKSFVWNNTLDPVLQPNPLSSNISVFLVTNSTASTAKFRVAVLSNV